MQKKLDSLYSEIWKKYGAFFAFSAERFNQQKKEGIKYVNVFAGLVAPKDTYKQMLDEMEKAFETAKLATQKPSAKIKSALKDLERANKKIVKRHRYACGLIDAPEVKEESAALFFESPDGQNGELYNELRALKWRGTMSTEYYWHVIKDGIKISYTEGDIYVTLI